MKKERGFSLIEVVIAIALLGIIAAGVLYALATTSKVLFIADERTTAESLARQQMEYIKDQPYSDDQWEYTVNYTKSSFSEKPSWWVDANPPPSLSELSEDYARYSVEACAEGFDADRDETPELGTPELPGDDDGIRRITVVVYHEHPERTKIVKLEAYKGDR